MLRFTASREPVYVMILISSYGTLERVGDEKKRIWTPTGAPNVIKTNFKTSELVHNHFQYQDSVDVHNGSKMYPHCLRRDLEAH